MSPKFACLIDREDEVKVKFGGNNGEVYGEVLATRLLWALGFPADRMYPVNVICRGCPAEFLGIERPNRPEPLRSRGHRAKGRRPPSGAPRGGRGRSSIASTAKHGGAPRAHRDALKLLAVFIQHSDTKPEQQRIVCASKAEVAAARDVQQSAAHDQRPRPHVRPRRRAAMPTSRPASTSTPGRRLPSGRTTQGASAICRSRSPARSAIRSSARPAASSLPIS